jgi:hypothetical protein
VAEREDGDQSRERVIGLVGCVKSKRAIPAPAKDLYVSTLFRGRRRYVEATCDSWFILSAAHGVVAPDDVLAPYDVTLTTASRAERRAWSTNVLDQLRGRLGALGGYRFEIHAGAAYTDFGLVEGLRRTGATVDMPAEGLGIGRQLRLYQEGPR